LESIEKDVEPPDWSVEPPDWLEFGASSIDPAKMKNGQIAERRRKEKTCTKNKNEAKSEYLRVGLALIPWENYELPAL